ncbi:MAG: hypothetical protein Q7J21_10810 [Rugosibacter sp.]|nr:hypothetical protein [Rugosibacter sp.]
MRIWILLLAACLLDGCGSGKEVQILACAEAIKALAQDNKACDGLSHAEQREAAKLASSKSGIIFIPPYEAKKARDEALANGEPLQQPSTFNEVRDQAMQGNYQAQRNLAYGYSSLPYSGQDKNPLLACAWRIVIIKSGSDKVDKTDISNHSVDCGSLDKTARAVSEAQAIELLKRIKP